MKHYISLFYATKNGDYFVKISNYFVIMNGKLQYHFIYLFNNITNKNKVFKIFWKKTPFLKISMYRKFMYTCYISYIIFYIIYIFTARKLNQIIRNIFLI